MIYLDNAATTRPLDGALVRAQRYLTECYYNPSALYHGGAEAARLLQEARSFLVSQIADPARFSMIFTSCGSEADNQAIFSAARRGNAVTTLGEHSAVFESFKELKVAEWNRVLRRFMRTAAWMQTRFSIWWMKRRRLFP